ncbi:MAG: SAM-dependent DNA methyltransferase [Faecousia sp.]
MTKQVKSKQRVADHGEVFTAEREVKAMCDLVKTETERIDSRFLEPACGDGNFLAEILRRKLAVVKKKYRKFPMDYEKYSVLAVSSIYGVDILQDNCEACRERLFEIWDKEYTTVCKKDVNENCRRSVRFILSRNIVCGNALSLMRVDENQEDTAEPIVFSEWAFVTGYQLQRSDYTFAKLMQGDDEARDLFGSRKKKRKEQEEQMTLFDSAEAEETPDDEGDFLKKYVTHYRRVWENEQ